MASTVHQKPKMHFSQFRMAKESEVVYEIWLCVWIAVIGELWKQRNKKIFRNGNIYHIEIFMVAQTTESLVMDNSEGKFSKFFLL